MARFKNIQSMLLTLVVAGGLTSGCATADRRTDDLGPDRLQRLEVRRVGPDYLIRVEGQRQPTYTVFRLHNPARVVVDLANYDVRALRQPRVIDRGEVARIRGRQFGDEQLGIGRLEIALRSLADFEAWSEGSSVYLRIQPAQAKIDKIQALTQTDDGLLLDESIDGEDLLLEEEFIEDIPLGDGFGDLPPLDEPDDLLPPLDEPAAPAPAVDDGLPPLDDDLPPLDEPVAPAPAVDDDLPPLDEPAAPEPLADDGLPPLDDDLPPLDEPVAPAAPAVEDEFLPFDDDLPPLDEPVTPEPVVAPASDAPSEADLLAEETLRGFEEPAALPPLDDLGPVQAEQLLDVTWQERNGESTVRIVGNGPIGDYNAMKLEAPPRIVVDVWNVSSLIPGEEFPVGNRQLQQIRVGNYADKVRVVLDLKGAQSLPFEADKDGDALIVRVKGAPVEDSRPVAMEEPEPVIEVADVRPAAKPAPAPAPAPAAKPAPARSEEVEPIPAAPRKPEIGPGTFEMRVADERPREMPRAETKRYTGRKISLDFKDADIDSVLRLIAEVSGLNIVTDGEVSGVISIRLVNVPWDQALDVILAAKQLGIRKMGNIIRIAPAAKLMREDEERLQAVANQEDLLPLYIRVVPVNYAEAGQVRGRVEQLLSKRGSVDVDSRTNVLIIKDIERVIDDIVALVRSLDAATPQVLIEAKIVEANTTFTRDLGIQWGGGYRNAPEFGNSVMPGRFGVAGGSAGNVGFESGEPNFAVDLPAAVGSGSGGALGLLFGSLNNSVVLDLRLSALESSGEGRIISSPRITTLDNEKASIEQGVAIPYSTVSAQGTQTQFVNATLKLDVTPHITPDRSILLDLNIVKNAPDDTFRSGDGQPAISKKEASSRMLVTDGETAVVGGIYTIDRGTSRSAVPFISRVPVLGWFFKKNTQRDTKTELLLFVTPRIIQK